MFPDRLDPIACNLRPCPGTAEFNSDMINCYSSFFGLQGLPDDCSVIPHSQLVKALLLLLAIKMDSLANVLRLPNICSSLYKYRDEEFPAFFIQVVDLLILLVELNSTLLYSEKGLVSKLLVKFIIHIFICRTHLFSFIFYCKNF